jgi:hypothetical protein
MIRIFVFFLPFETKWKKAGLTVEDYPALERVILEDPNAGDAIQGGGGIRKIRFARPGQGKSGGVRVFYLDLKTVGKTYFLACLLKNESANITAAQKTELAKLVEQLKKEARK